MKWLSAKDAPLPKDESTFLALWKGQFCLAAWDEEDNRFWVCWMPNQSTISWKVDPEREGKFTHWAKLERPEDY